MRCNEIKDCLDESDEKQCKLVIFSASKHPTKKVFRWECSYQYELTVSNLNFSGRYKFINRVQSKKHLKSCLFVDIPCPKGSKLHSGNPAKLCSLEA